MPWSLTVICVIQASYYRISSPHAYVCGIVHGTRVHIKWPYPYPYLRRHSGHPAAGANCNAWVRFRAGSRESLPPFALLFPRHGDSRLPRMDRAPIDRDFFCLC